MVSKKPISITLNREKIAAEVECRITLAEFIRERLGLTGTKIGCNRGECGSCTVILDGLPVYSCTILAVDADGKEVVTIEGMGSENSLDPIQEAFIDYDALQCGYCTSGMILSVKALLAEKITPTEEDVRNAIDGNLCRCGSYINIIKATLAVSEKSARKGNGPQ
jgi:aerobic carbon-monoxide dehydrogenase small subunit